MPGKNLKMDETLYFLKYAYPCVYTLKNLGKVSQDDVEILEDAVKKWKPLSKDYLEKIFSAAFERMKKVSEETGMDYWSNALIHEYFVNRHNINIDNREGTYAKLPDSICDLCKVYKGTVSEVIGKKPQVVQLKGIQRAGRYINYYNIDLEPGDKVTTHFGFIIEKYG